VHPTKKFVGNTRTQKTPPNSKTKVSHSYKFLAPTLKSTNIPMHAMLLPRDTEKGRHVEAWVKERKKRGKCPYRAPSIPFPLLVMNEYSLMNDNDDDECPPEDNDR